MSLDDVDYSAGQALDGLLDYLQARSITPALARADTALMATLTSYGIAQRIAPEHVFGSLTDAVAAFSARTKA